MLILAMAVRDRAIFLIHITFLLCYHADYLKHKINDSDHNNSCVLLLSKPFLQCHFNIVDIRMPKPFPESYFCKVEPVLPKPTHNNRGISLWRTPSNSTGAHSCIDSRKWTDSFYFQAFCEWNDCQKYIPTPIFSSWSSSSWF